MIRRDLYDKSQWGQDLWTLEPDYFAWIDCETDYGCVMRRNLYGAWCGFVGLDAGHALYQSPQDDEGLGFVDVHGGVDFVGLSEEDDAAFSPPARRWWIGFSCMHANDLVPSLEIEMFQKSEKKLSAKLQYRTAEYVKENVELLAAQLAFHDERIR